jgi:lipopolysaccharide export LptBFGC system permease protein LptF
MQNQFLKFLKLDGLLDSVKGYIEARLQLFKLEMQEKASNVIATAIFIVLMAFCGLMALMFLSLALGNYLNEVLGNSYLGFCMLGAFYLLLLLVLFRNVSKGSLHGKVQGAIFKAMAAKKKKDDPGVNKND